MTRTGLFGGAFDPVHNGHIALAKAVADFYNLDKLVFIPTKNPPHKNAHFASGDHRLNMLRIGVASLDDRFSVSDMELSDTGISYTYRTIERWSFENPGDDVYFIAGSDIFATLETWYRWQDILNTARFIVVKRSGFEFNKMFALMKSNYQQKIESGRILLFDTEIENISSTLIRSEINIDSCLVPEAVLQYIEEYNLYEGTK